MSVASAELEAAASRITTLLNQLLDGGANFAVARSREAITTVSWTDDFTTVHVGAPGPTHFQLLTEALGRRVTGLRLVIASIHVLATITAARVNPLAVPGAIRAIRALLQELEDTVNPSTPPPLL